GRRYRTSITQRGQNKADSSAGCSGAGRRSRRQRGWRQLDVDRGAVGNRAAVAFLGFNIDRGATQRGNGRLRHRDRQGGLRWRKGAAITTTTAAATGEQQGGGQHCKYPSEKLHGVDLQTSNLNVGQRRAVKRRR